MGEREKLIVEESFPAKRSLRERLNYMARY
jgi:hypothetical protein